MHMENIAIQKLFYNKERGIGLKETILETSSQSLQRSLQSYTSLISFPGIEPILHQRNSELLVSQFVDEDCLMEPMPLMSNT